MSLKDDIKKLFESGSIPTEQDFERLIDFSADADNIDNGSLSSDRLPQDLKVNSIEGDGSKLKNLNAESIVGLLSDTVIPDIDAAKIKTGTLNNDRLPANIEVTSLAGSGDGITHLNASNIQGTLPEANLPAIDASKVQSGKLSNERLPSNIDVTSLSGNGEGITHINASNIQGTLPEATLPAFDASNIQTGQLNNERLPQDLSVSTLAGNGFLLTNLNAKNVEGVLPSESIPNIDASSITTGKLNNDRLPDIISASNFIGNGEHLEHLSAGNIDGVLPNETVPELSADKITSGELSNDRLPTDIAVNSFTGQGTNLTNLSASNITEGTLDQAHLPMATSTDLGISRFATEEEAQLGEASDKTVSPKQLSLAISRANQSMDEKLGLVKAGLKFRDNVQVVATDYVNLSTATAIDGYDLLEGDRVLLTNQGDTSPNTVWVFNGPGDWEVAEDVDGDIDGELAIGISVEVNEGENYANTYWSVAAIDNGIVWKKRTDLNDFSFGDGLKVNGLAVSVDDEYISKLNAVVLGDGLLKVDGKITIDTDWLNERIEILLNSALEAATQAQPEKQPVSLLEPQGTIQTLQSAPEPVKEEITPITYTFTSAGATGRQGPNQTQVNNAYANTSLASSVTVVGSGIQKWRVPKTGNYLIVAEGAQGCVNGSQGSTPSNELGRGAKMAGYFMLNEGQILWILVGQSGEGTVGTYGHGGGGGGTFVATGNGADQSNSQALIVAGGGGAIGNAQINYMAKGQITTAGASGYKQNADDESNNNEGGKDGGAGSTGGKGFRDSQDMGMDAAAGWSGSGVTSQSFLAGGLGALATKGGDGGFGGGGALRSNEGYATAAGGGGYSGGGASDSTNGWTFAGGGGGSINKGTDQSNEVGGAEAGHGKVVITLK